VPEFSPSSTASALCTTVAASVFSATVSDAPEVNDGAALTLVTAMATALLVESVPSEAVAMVL